MREFTYQDAIDHVIDYLGGTPAVEAIRDAKRAVTSAYRDFGNAHRWNYLHTVGRLGLSAPFSAGEVTYARTGTDVEFQLTLAGGVFPEWVTGSWVKLTSRGEWVHIARRVSDTIVALDYRACPDEDIVDPISFVIYRDSYLLPEDFVNAEFLIHTDRPSGLSYIPTSDWVQVSRGFMNSGTPWVYTITGDSANPGRSIIRFSPMPASVESIDYSYYRTPRPLLFSEYGEGHINTVEGSPDFVGGGTTFVDRMVGSVLRISSASAVPPSSWIGSNPPGYEARIVKVTDLTNLTAALPARSLPLTTKYVISDPVDIDESLLTAFLRGCEHQISLSRSIKDRPSAKLAYYEALSRARGANSKTSEPRSAWDGLAGFGKRPIWTQPKGYFLPEE
jgi:hypothetical protein